MTDVKILPLQGGPRSIQGLEGTGLQFLCLLCLDSIFIKPLLIRYTFRRRPSCSEHWLYWCSVAAVTSSHTRHLTVLEVGSSRCALGCGSLWWLLGSVQRAEAAPLSPVAAPHLQSQQPCLFRSLTLTYLPFPLPRTLGRALVPPRESRRTPSSPGRLSSNLTSTCRFSPPLPWSSPLSEVLGIRMQMFGGALFCPPELFGS